MTTNRSLRSVLRLLPVLLGLGWAAMDLTEPPAAPPGADEPGQEAGPVLQLALPSPPSLRVHALDAAERALLGGGPDAAAAVGSTSLPGLGAIGAGGVYCPLATCRTLLRHDSNRIRGPPTPVG